MSKTSTSVLAAYFDPSVNQCSRVCEDLIRVVKHDEKGGEYVTWEPFDSAEYQKSLGPVENWSLNSLLKAGIDPNFGIRTGYNTRLEGIDDVNAMASVADSILAENNEQNND